MLNRKRSVNVEVEDVAVDAIETLDLPAEDWSVDESDVDPAVIGTTVELGTDAYAEERYAEDTRPLEMRIGWVPFSKKESLEYAGRWARDNYSTPRNSFVQVLAYRGGYIFEVHNGGVGRGCLSSVVKLLDETDSILVQHGAGGVRILRDEGRDSIHCIMIDDQNAVSTSEGIIFADSMKRLEKPAAGIAVAGLTFAFLGVMTMMCAAGFKYGMFNSHSEPTVHANPIPFDEIAKVTPFANNDSTYVSQLLYKSGKWEVKTNDVIVLNDKGEPVSTAK